MSYENWNMQKAKKQLSSLNKKNNHNKYDIDIQILEQILGNTIVPWESPFTLTQKLEFDRAKLLEYEYFTSIIKKLSTFKTEKNKKLSDIDLPPTELLYFANSFFQEVYPDWFEIFNKIYKEKKNNIRFIPNMGKEKDSQNRSYEILIPSLKYSYISCLYEGTIEDLFNIVHEYTHAIVDQIKLRTSYDDHYPFSELPSILSELIAKDLILSTYTNIDEEVRSYLVANTNLYINYARDILSAKEYLDTYHFSEDASDEVVSCYIAAYAKGKNNIEENLTNRLQLENICYTVSFIYAVELYQIYLSDKELFSYLINNIVSMETKPNYYEEMINLGILPNKNMGHFLEKIRRV